MRALQIDHRAVTAAGDMYVGGAMIVEVDRDAQAIKAEDGRHGALLPETQAVG